MQINEKIVEAKFEFWRRGAILACRENFSRQYRGSDWVVLALSYRLALGVATSIFLRAHIQTPLGSPAGTWERGQSVISSRTGLNAFSTSTRPISRAKIGSGIQRQTFGTSGRLSCRLRTSISPK